MILRTWRCTFAKRTGLQHFGLEISAAFANPTIVQWEPELCTTHPQKKLLHLPLHPIPSSANKHSILELVLYIGLKHTQCFNNNEGVVYLDKESIRSSIFMSSYARAIDFVALSFMERPSNGLGAKVTIWEQVVLMWDSSVGVRVLDETPLAIVLS